MVFNFWLSGPFAADIFILSGVSRVNNIFRSAVRRVRCMICSDVVRALPRALRLSGSPFCAYRDANEGVAPSFANKVGIDLSRAISRKSVLSRFLGK